MAGKHARLNVRLAPDEAETLRARARLHGVNVSTYARSILFGRRAGSEPGSPSASADRWWDSLPPNRRAQVHGWIDAAPSLRHQDDTVPIEELLAAAP